MHLYQGVIFPLLSQALFKINEFVKEYLPLSKSLKILHLEKASLQQFGIRNFNSCLLVHVDWESV